MFAGLSKKEINLTLLLVWPLLASMFLIMVGNGLQGTLLSLRGSAAGFSSSTIGLVMSLYYLGYVVGWFIVPRMISSVGHIRVFAGFASMASTTILLHGVFVDPYLWAIVRFISGVSFVSLFIVSESWLNNIAPNHLRGQVLSAYFFVINGGLLFGQFLLNITSIESIGLFVLISILVSFSLVPITLANKPSPGYEEPEHLPIRKLFGLSPLSVFCVVLTGFVGAGVIAIGPVYAQMIGYSPAKIAFFIAAYVLGGSTFPLFTGGLSDRWDRRKVIIGAALTGTVISLLAFMFNQYLLILTIAIGGLVASTHSVAIAMMNDRIKPSQMTSATASLILINGVSACFAPIALGIVLDVFGPTPFFTIIAAFFAGLSIYGLYRNFTGPEIDVETQGEYKPIPIRSAVGVGKLMRSSARKSGGLGMKQNALISQFSQGALNLFRFSSVAEKKGHFNFIKKAKKNDPD